MELKLQPLIRSMVRYYCLGDKIRQETYNVYSMQQTYRSEIMDANINQKKEFIVITAIDLIHECGINNVSTKEIAKRLGISESLIFKVYPKKNDLILAVLDHFSLYDKDMFHTAQEKYEDGIEAIMFYLDNFLLYYENYPAITAVLQVLDLHNGVPQIDERAIEICQSRLDHIKQLVVKTQAKGIFDHTIDPEIVADVLYSAFKGMCIKWRQMNFSFSLKDRTNIAIRLIIKALKN